MKKKEEVPNIHELVKPTLNKVFVRLNQESDKYADGIYKPVQGPLTTEPYCTVISVGEQAKSIKPDDIVLMRTGTGAEVFELYGEKYAILTEHDIVAIFHPLVVEEFKKNIKGSKPTLSD